MKKRKHKKRKSHEYRALNKGLTLAILSFSLLAFVGSTIYIAYSIGFEEAQEKQANVIYQTQADNNLLRNRLQATLQEKKYATPQSQVKEHKAQNIVRMKAIPKVITPVHTPVVKKSYTPKKIKPKLAIILDDVSYASEVRDVKSIGLKKVNFSFFPVTQRHPQTAKLASKEPFYMVHLPLEAMHFSAEEPKTLRINDSIQKMEQRFADIKKDFPRLRFVNNHTGSKFTSNTQAVTKLFKAARRYNLDIIDSRTIASTQLPQVYGNFHRKLLSRDVFLDHQSDVNYICGQIKIAVNTAIHKGKAIAIGHPRKHTIQALRACKSYLNAVDLVYVTEL